ncbi:hypothetical protein ASPCADRAFT_209689, partial [Aspergillus carbonarius ITEM 5010]
VLTPKGRVSTPQRRTFTRQLTMLWQNSLGLTFGSENLARQRPWLHAAGPQKVS